MHPPAVQPSVTDVRPMQSTSTMNVARRRAECAAPAGLRLIRRGLVSAWFLGFALLAGRSPALAGNGVPTSDPGADVIPLFKTKCLRCHGGAAKKADLDLGTTAGVLRGGESGPAVVPGKPEDSPLFVKVRDGVMPPGKKDRLTEAEIAAVRRWIEAGARGQAVEAAVTEHDVLPILLRRCTVCHGARVREAGLDLRSRAGLLKGGKSGPAVVRGKPADSLLLRRIRAGEMPPIRRLVEVSIKPIEPAEVAVLTKWVEQGAPAATAVPDVATT